MYPERKSIGNKIALKKFRRLKKSRCGSRITTMLAVNKGVKIPIVEIKKKMEKQKQRWRTQTRGSSHEH